MKKLGFFKKMRLSMELKSHYGKLGVKHMWQVEFDLGLIGFIVENENGEKGFYMPDENGGLRPIQGGEYKQENVQKLF